MMDMLDITQWDKLNKIDLMQIIHILSQMKAIDIDNDIENIIFVDIKPIKTRDNMFFSH